jgi:TRAP-type C4-dicarboxylate transport system permease small subunit
MEAVRAEGAPTHQPGAPPALPAWRRAFNAFTDAQATLGTLLIVFVMGVIIVDVTGRFLFNRPLRGVPEMVVMSMAAIVFLQIASTLRSGRVIASDAFTGWLQRRSPVAARRLQAAYCVAGAAIFGVVISAMVPLLLRSIDTADRYGTPGVFSFPKWPVRAAILLGATSMALEFLLQAADHWRAASGGKEERR